MLKGFTLGDAVGAALVAAGIVVLCLDTGVADWLVALVIVLGAGMISPERVAGLLRAYKDSLGGRRP